MKRLAFIFTQPPHTSSAGREGLDALLAASAFSEDIQVFLLGMVFFNFYPIKNRLKFFVETMFQPLA